MITGFIILRLRSILGRKTGHESKVYPNFAEKFSMPQKDVEPKENLDILEQSKKRIFKRRRNSLRKYLNFFCKWRPY